MRNYCSTSRLDWQHHCEQRGRTQCKGSSSWGGWWLEPWLKDSPEKNDDWELRLQIEGSLHGRMSLQKVRQQDQIFLGNSKVDPVVAVTTQSGHGIVSSTGLSAYQSQLSSTRQEGAGSHPLPHIATTFPWIMLLWPHPYSPWGGSFSIPKSNACLSWLLCWQTEVSTHASILHTQNNTVAVPGAVLVDLLSV